MMQASSRGKIWMAGTAVCFAVSNLFDQMAMIHADPFLATAVKACIVALFGIFVLHIRGYVRFTGRSHAYWIRAIAIYASAGIVSEVIGTAAYFQAMKLGGINIAIPIVNTWFIWAALAGIVFLREPPRPQIFGGLFIAIAGLALLTHFQQHAIPFTPKWHQGVLFALVAALGWAASTTLIRKGQLEDIDRFLGMTIEFLAALVGLSIVIFATKRGSLLTVVPLSSYLYLIISAIFAGVLGMFSMYTALRLAPIGQVIPIMAGYPVLAVLGGRFVLGNQLNLGMGFAMALVVCGVILAQVTGLKKGRGTLNQ